MRVGELENERVWVWGLKFNPLNSKSNKQSSCNRNVINNLLPFQMAIRRRKERKLNLPI